MINAGTLRGMSTEALLDETHPHAETAKMIKGLTHPDPLIAR
jgi:hypothetical protein